MTNCRPPLLIWKGREVRIVKQIFASGYTSIDVCNISFATSPLVNPFESSKSIIFSQPVSTLKKESRKRAHSSENASTNLRHPRNLCVVKQIFLDNTTSERAFAELRVFRSLEQSCFIVNFFFAARHQDTLCLGLEFCSGGDLHSLIYSENYRNVLNTFRLFDMVVYLAEIVSALQHIHKHNIYHGDIKLANIFISSSGHIRLGDFGEAKFLPALQKQFSHGQKQHASTIGRARTMTQGYEKDENQQFTKIKDESMLVEPVNYNSKFEEAQSVRRCRSASEAFAKSSITNTRIVTQSGTLPYCAPEVLFRKFHRFEPDWWSFGVLSCELLVGSNPFGNIETEEQSVILESICYQDMSYLIGKLPFPCRRARDFVGCLLQRDLKKRKGDRYSCDFPNSAEKLIDYDIKQHVLFECIDWDALSALNYSSPFQPKLPSYLGGASPDLNKSKSFYGESMYGQYKGRKTGSNSVTSSSISTSRRGSLCSQARMELDLGDLAVKIDTDPDTVNETTATNH